jgi:nitrate reductase NapAB chaperone NapD
MPVLGYLALPQSGAKHQLLEELNDLQFCEVFPADNEDVLILVTDTPDKNTEKELQKQLKQLKFVESLSMAFGYNDEQQKSGGGDHEVR